MKTLLVIAGPTASGKTAVAVRLARHFGTVVLSADSRQFYREMSVGTAKPTQEEMQGVPHYFVDSLSIFDDYTAGDFERDALALLGELYQTHDVIILAGGSGLFIRALCEGLDRFPDVPQEVRNQIEERYREKGLVFLQEKLKEADPAYYAEADLQNPQRLIRALSVHEASGLPFSHFRRGETAERSFTPAYYLLEWDRDTLYRRIDRRVDDMVDRGLLEEARTLYPYRAQNALQTVGYKELFDHFEGKTTLDEAIGLVKQHSRNYAKRQLTWFRKHGDWISVRGEEAGQWLPSFP